MESIKISKINDMDEYVWVESNSYASESDYGFSNTAFFIPFETKKEAEKYVRQSLKLMKIVSAERVKKYYSIDDEAVKSKIMSDHRCVCEYGCECTIDDLDIDWEWVEKDALSSLCVDWVG